MEFTISIKLDTRREKENGLYPVKLRLYSKTLRDRKIYSLGTDLSIKDFQEIWIEGQNKSFRGKKRDLQIQLKKYESRALDEAAKIEPFSFEQFEKNYFRKSTDSINVFYHFEKIIKENIQNNKIGTSESYKYTLKSLKAFANDKRNTELTKLSFSAITPEWLQKYEDFMLLNGKSITTVGIFTRMLRTVFNIAIHNKEISNEIYPFGKRKYQIPESKTVKKALNKQQLKVFFDSKPQTIEQEKAKDFWFFSYACSGINLKDICLLKYEDLNNGKFSYYRAKTFAKTRQKTKMRFI
ncbi:MULTISPECIES: phage integrase SAM-like domain-containing protein [Flavobacteriaceae]|uniref:Phage integrase SAM-like domain-containing protein n=2 Tax=Flavobacteriaceae TaxID=49546 RepID=A0A4Y8AT79_9FLAO|nr:MULTISPECIES: phage integrase SAM-like domain-containing protein [Flavobacteriaceae]TEW73898.1 hypothetical protein E2488_10495 [Gramella jeungdoensis]GGK38554.1 hypothetical protein GCM10007963_03310 [Lutibacter litoralis]